MSLPRLLRCLRAQRRSILLTSFAALAWLCAAAAPAPAVTLVPVGATWKYLDNGSDQGTAWRAISFNDATWSSGAAQLGYGDGDEATVVSYGPSATNKYVTTYFRRSFNVADASIYFGLTIRLLRDDGAVVYLNGQEVLRSNMPAGAIGYTTFATTAIGAPEETTYYQTNITNSLVSGTNVLAVEVHQANLTSSDLSFDLELTAATEPAVIRGPYLQDGAANEITVRWRSNVLMNSRVRYGASPASLTLNADVAGLRTEHEVRLSGLAAGTRYYYSVGSSTSTLAGGDADHFFFTAPLTGTARPTRIWVLGDSGTANADAMSVRNAYTTFNGSRYTDLWLMLGDNAYTDGTDSEFQAAVFDMYPAMLRQSVLWPTLGNHDGHTADSASQSGPYYDIFTLPRQGEAGGMASGTEAYYSFDFGNIHFVCLESYETNRAANGPMLTWLANDLAAVSADWVIAFWHHPPYSKGSHDSDTETELIEMRQNALPILEDYGVDLVLSGHSHSYERSFLIDGHYGTSTTLTSSMIKDGGDGRINGDGAYHKPTLGLGANEGAVYAVAGSSGEVSGGALNHPAMFISLASLGSMVLDVDGDRLDARFLNQTGVTLDSFSIVKGPLPAAPSDLTATAFSSNRIDLAWSDRSGNEDGFVVERATDGVNFAPVASLAAGSTAYSDSGLSAATAYQYRVHAFNNAGASANSNLASATTLGNATATPTRTATQTLTQTATSTRSFTPTPTPSSSVSPTRTPGSTPVTFTLSGQVLYYSNAKPVPNVNVVFQGLAPAAALTNAVGQYSQSLAGNENWVMRPQRTGGASSITAIDASTVLQAAVGLVTLTPLQRFACDANGSNTITAIDASYILQYVVGLRGLPAAQTCGSDWLFQPAPAAGNAAVTALQLSAGNCQMGALGYAPLAADTAGQSFNAILIGDCNGSWMPPAGGGGVRPAPLKTRLGPPRVTRDHMTVPLMLDPETRHSAVALVIRYDPRLARALGVRRKPGAKSAALLAANTGQDGVIRVALASATALGTSDAILLLRFETRSARAAWRSLRVAPID